MYTSPLLGGSCWNHGNDSGELIVVIITSQAAFVLSILILWACLVVAVVCHVVRTMVVFVIAEQDLTKALKSLSSMCR